MKLNFQILLLNSVLLVSSLGFADQDRVIINYGSGERINEIRKGNGPVDFSDYDQTNPAESVPFRSYNPGGTSIPPNFIDPKTGLPMIAPSPGGGPGIIGGYFSNDKPKMPDLPPLPESTVDPYVPKLNLHELWAEVKAKRDKGREEYEKTGDYNINYPGFKSTDPKYLEPLMEVYYALDKAEVTTPEQQRARTFGVGMLRYADNSFLAGAEEEGFFSLDNARAAVDFIVGFVPVVGTFTDGYAAITGYNLITGEKLTPVERAFAGLGAISGGVGSRLGVMLKMAEHAGDFTKGAKYADKALDTLYAARKIADEALDIAENWDKVGYLADTGKVLTGRAERLAGFADVKERKIAEYLEDFGRKVEKNPLESVNGAGKQGDAFVDGVKHEFKTLDPGAVSKTIANRTSESLKRGGQARNLVFDARNTGMSKVEAQRGVFRALGSAPKRLDNITVIGNDYFIGYGPRL